MHPNEIAILRRATTEAATFFARFISSRVDEHKRREFVFCFEQLLASRFERHWYPDHPSRGQAYRCIRLNPSSHKEPLIETAVIVAGLTYNDIQLPLELTVWIDPDKVTYRFGEDDGSHCTLISFDRQLASNKTMAAASLRPNSNKQEPRMHAMACIREGHKFCFITQHGIGVFSSSILPLRLTFHRLLPVLLLPSDSQRHKEPSFNF